MCYKPIELLAGAGPAAGAKRIQLQRTLVIFRSLNSQVSGRILSLRSIYTEWLMTWERFFFLFFFFKFRLHRSAYDDKLSLHRSNHRSLRAVHIFLRLQIHRRVADVLAHKSVSVTCDLWLHQMDGYDFSLSLVSVWDRNYTPFAHSLRQSGWRTTAAHKKSVCLFINDAQPTYCASGKSNHFLSKIIIDGIPHSRSLSHSPDRPMCQTTACIRH